MADPTSPSPYSENKKFEPKVKVELDPPKDTLITLEELSKCDGKAATPRGGVQYIHVQAHECTSPGVRAVFLSGRVSKETGYDKEEAG